MYWFLWSHGDTMVGGARFIVFHYPLHCLPDVLSHAYLDGDFLYSAKIMDFNFMPGHALDIEETKV